MTGCGPSIEAVSFAIARSVLGIEQMCALNSSAVSPITTLGLAKGERSCRRLTAPLRTNLGRES